MFCTYEHSSASSPKRVGGPDQAGIPFPPYLFYLGRVSANATGLFIFLLLSPSWFCHSSFCSTSLSVFPHTYILPDMASNGVVYVQSTISLELILIWNRDSFLASRPKALSIHLYHSSKRKKLDVLTLLLHSLTRNLLPNIVSLHVSISTSITSGVLAILCQAIRPIARTLQVLLLVGPIIGHVRLAVGVLCIQHTIREPSKLNLKLFEIFTARTESSLTLEPFFRSLSPTLQSLSLSKVPSTLLSPRSSTPFYNLSHKSLLQPEIPLPLPRPE
jgi:hypothetical protein